VNSRFLLLNFAPFTVEFFDFAVELRGWTGELRYPIGDLLFFTVELAGTIGEFSLSFVEFCPFYW